MIMNNIFSRVRPPNNSFDLASPSPPASYYYNSNNNLNALQDAMGYTNNDRYPQSPSQAVMLTRKEIEQAAITLNISPTEFKAAGPVRLYRFTPTGTSPMSKRDSMTNGWTFTGYSGIAGVLIEPKFNAVFIVVVDVKRNVMVLSQECYLGFNYQQLSQSQMHAFEGDDAIYGLLFAENFDAQAFATTVNGLIALCNNTEDHARSFQHPASAIDLQQQQRLLLQQQQQQQALAGIDGVGEYINFSRSTKGGIQLASPRPELSFDHGRHQMVNTPLTAPFLPPVPQQQQQQQYYTSPHVQPYQENSYQIPSEDQSIHHRFGGKIKHLFKRKDHQQQATAQRRPVISGPTNFIHAGHVGLNMKEEFGNVPDELRGAVQHNRRVEYSTPGTTSNISNGDSLIRTSIDSNSSASVAYRSSADPYHANRQAIPIVTANAAPTSYSLPAQTTPQPTLPPAPQASLQDSYNTGAALPGMVMSPPMVQQYRTINPQYTDQQRQLPPQPQVSTQQEQMPSISKRIAPNPPPRTAPQINIQSAAPLQVPAETPTTPVQIVPQDHESSKPPPPPPKPTTSSLLEEIRARRGVPVKRLQDGADHSGIQNTDTHQATASFGDHEENGFAQKLKEALEARRKDLGEEESDSDDDDDEFL